MPAFAPIKRRELIRCLKEFGFEGPYAGGKHEFMVKDEFRLTLPNPHRSDIGKSLLAKILDEAGISREDWENL